MEQDSKVLKSFVAALNELEFGEEVLAKKDNPQPELENRLEIDEPSLELSACHLSVGNLA